jgi:REP element-mobilizing transposase RayT
MKCTLILAERATASYLGGTCNSLDCPVITVGGVADHVHLLCRLSRRRSLADLLEEVKRGSSKWVKTKGGIVTKFSWQNGYGAFSVGQSEVGRVRIYIEGQEEHHRKKTFQEEFRAFLKEHEIEYDERYVWD